jgi:hypothetical protein
MSYFGSKSQAYSDIASVELSENSRSNSGSAILAGHSGPGGAAAKTKAAGEVQVVGRLRAGINKPRTRTDSLTRKYAASGS